MRSFQDRLRIFGDLQRLWRWGLRGKLWRLYIPIMCVARCSLLAGVPSLLVPYLAYQWLLEVLCSVPAATGLAKHTQPRSLRITWPQILLSWLLASLFMDTWLQKDLQTLWNFAANDLSLTS